MKKCISGKNSYEDEKVAQKAVDLGVYLSKDKTLQLRYYRCLQCFQYHLTSQKKLTKKGKK